MNRRIYRHRLEGEESGWDQAWAWGTHSGRRVPGILRGRGFPVSVLSYWPEVSSRPLGLCGSARKCHQNRKQDLSAVHPCGCQGHTRHVFLSFWATLRPSMNLYKRWTSWTRGSWPPVCHLVLAWWERERLYLPQNSADCFKEESQSFTRD